MLDLNLTNNILNIERAEYELNKAYESNPTAWAEHSKYTAKACKIIAERCEDLDEEKAYIYGLLHDIGRYAGITSEKHLIDGYKYCINYGWEKLAQICISHAFMIQDIETAIGEFDMSEEDYNFMKEFIKSAKYDDYDLLVQLCDSLAMTNGFCILEKRFIDVAIRYGTFKHSSLRWKKIFDIKKYFENKIGISIYKLLPNITESIFY